MRHMDVGADHRGPPCVLRRTAALAIEASDGTTDASIGSELGELADPDIVPSGVSEMSVQTDAVGDGTWQPFSPIVTLTLGELQTATAIVRLRDSAGNETPVRTLTLRRCDGSGLERAILLDEQALNALELGDLARARLLVEQSLAELGQSIDVIQQRVQTPQLADHALDVEIFSRLVKVRGTKKASTKVSGAKAVEQMRKLLSEALSSELEVADLVRRRRLQL